MPKKTIYRPASQPPAVKLNLYASPISAGFPSPADDYIEASLDLNELLIDNKPATYLVRVSGDSMVGAAITNGDILIVDASKKPQHNKIVVATVDGEFLVKRFWVDGKKVFLRSENPHYAPIEINPEQDLAIMGVVTGIVRQVT